MSNIEKHHLLEEETYEETRKPRENVGSEKAINYNESEKIVEKEKREEELSPEIIEKIMEKVQDINTEGTAVHAIAQVDIDRRSRSDPYDLLRDILKDGLLGSPSKKSENDGPITREKWAKYARSRKAIFVFFNIIGRDIKKVENSCWVDCINPTVIIFDTTFFKEKNYDSEEEYEEDVDWMKYDEKKFETRVFRPGGTGIAERRFKFVPEPGESNKERVEYTFIPYSDYGYKLTFRVAPHFFKGIVYRVDRERTMEEIKAIQKEKIKLWQEGKPTVSVWDTDIERIQKDYKYIEDDDEKVKQKRVDEISSIMNKVYQKKQSSLLPIYDIHGNLWWPEKMSYEEVKKFVEERNKEKNQKQ